MSVGTHSLACQARRTRGCGGWNLSAGFVRKSRDSHSLGTVRHRVQKRALQLSFSCSVCQTNESMRPPGLLLYNMLTNLGAENLYSPQEKPSSWWEHRTSWGWCFRSHSSRWGSRLLHTVRQQLLMAAPHSRQQSSGDRGLGHAGLVRATRNPCWTGGGGAHRGSKGCPRHLGSSNAQVGGTPLPPASLSTAPDWAARRPLDSGRDRHSGSLDPLHLQRQTAF